MRCTEELEAEHVAVVPVLDVPDVLATRLDAREPVDAGDVADALAV